MRPRPPTLGGPVLGVAGRQFAENGVGGASVRAITAEAGVNVAAVNHYFPTKDELSREVVGRRLGPPNEERAPVERQRGAASRL